MNVAMELLATFIHRFRRSVEPGEAGLQTSLSSSCFFVFFVVANPAACRRTTDSSPMRYDAGARQAG
jgi:hypothetical protein